MDTPANTRNTRSIRDSCEDTASEEHHALAHELARVVASPLFAGAQAHQRLLRYLVAHAQADRATMLKETVVGIEVFQRPAHSFDPRRDSIVRVEARRLRERLRQHYATQPPGSWMIELPKGSYRPKLVRYAAPEDAAIDTAADTATDAVTDCATDSATDTANDAANVVTTDAAAELIERGHYFLRLGHEEGHRKALQRFEAAALAAPGRAAAHAGIARAWTQLVATNLEPPRPGVDVALAAVQRALDLDPLHAESLVLAAALTHRYAFDWPAAQALFTRALQAAPRSAYVRHSRALSLMMRADFEGAAADLAVARELDPLHLSLRAHLALLDLYRRNWAAAAAGLHGLLDMSADNVLGMSLLAYVMLCQGGAEATEAAEHQYAAVAQRHPQLSIGPLGVIWARVALGEQGQQGQGHQNARQDFAKLVQGWPGRYLSPYQLAMTELRLGDRPAALTLLERAVHERDPNALCLPVDPAFDSLHAEPRFQALRRLVLNVVDLGVDVAAPPTAAPR